MQHGGLTHRWTGRRHNGLRPLWPGLLLQLLLLVTPVPTQAQPTPAAPEPERATLEVGPSLAWAETGIAVAPGDRLEVRVDGQVYDERETAMGPIGREDDPDETMPLPGAPFGALIGRIGGRIFLVGESYDGLADTEGPLALNLNLPDHRRDDFQGAFVVTVARYPAPPRDADPDRPVGNEVAADSDGLGDNAAAPVEVAAPVAASARKAPAPTVPPVRENMPRPSFPWLPLVAALAVAVAAAALGFSKWRRTRTANRTKARLAVAHSLSPGPAAGGPPPPELKPAWPTVATRWRVEEREPAFAGWAGKEGSDG